MFSKEIKSIIPQVEKIGTSLSIDHKKTLSLLEKCAKGESLDTNEIIELINGTYSEENKRLILEFSAQYKRTHNSTILLLPPLYLSSKCENKCLYCDFSSEGERLSHNEFLDELDALLDFGYRSIELVSSQDSGFFLRGEPFDLNNQLYNIDTIAEYFELAHLKLEKTKCGMLTSNIPPVDVDSYKKLKSVGLDCCLIWQETFNPQQYSKLHNKAGLKAIQAFRLDTLENAIEAGIEHIAGAFLKGLYDWRKEEATMYLFDRYLKTKNGKGFSIIGSPRLKGEFIQSELVKPYFVSDEDYELNIALDRILFDGILWLQTREMPSFNKMLLNRYGGGIILTLDCSTAPGGYKRPPKGKAQFPVFRQKLSKAVSELENDGYEVIFGWSSQTLSNMQRNIRKKADGS